jgi:hypothetical protein
VALISVTAPGDVIGLLTAAFNAQAETAKAIAALAQDQSPEGRAAAAALNEFFALPIAAIKFANGKLGIDPAAPKTTP